jgi:hypothetical protein
MEITITGTTHRLAAADFWQAYPSAPEDPPGTQVFGYELAESAANLFIRPIDESELLPDRAEDLIEGIREYLPDNGAIIKVETGTTANGYAYRYSIVKLLQKPHGVQYNLTLQLLAERPFQLQGFFAEAGTTGERDTVVYLLWSQAQAKGQITAETAPWMRDPYSGSTDGFARNYSEAERFDEMFPNHPLSVARALVRAFLQIT